MSHNIKYRDDQLLSTNKRDLLNLECDAFNEETNQSIYSKEKKIIDYNNLSLKDKLKAISITDNNIVESCEKICKIAHSGQLDKAGKPYYLHPQAVASNCHVDIAKSIALLHDVIEDTDITEGVLLELGVPSYIVSRVVLLTKERGEPYMEYIQHIAQDRIASEVKYYDLKHNTDLSRNNGVPVVSNSRYTNYLKALEVLNGKYHFE